MKKLLRNISLVIVLFAIIVAVNLLWFGFIIFDGQKSDTEDTQESTSVFQNIIDFSTDDTKEVETDYLYVPENEGTKESKKDNNNQSLQNNEKKTDILYYSQLDDQGKKTYYILLDGLTKRKEVIAVYPCPEDSLNDAWCAILNDHEEIFWADSYHFTTISGMVAEVQPDYIYTKSEIAARQKQINEIVKQVLKGIDSNSSDYDKILYVYEYIINSTDYVTDSKNNQYIDSVLLNKESVCAGYARTTKLLLDQLGIENYFVVGFDKKDPVEGSHTWNIVKCDGNYYHVDTTWGDPICSPDEKREKQSEISYDYLNCNDEEILRSHIIDSKYSYPACNRLDQNYYVVNKRYFDKYNFKKISALIHDDIDKGKNHSTFKYSSETEYKKALEGIKDYINDGRDYYNKKNKTSVSECFYYNKDNPFVIDIFWTDF